MVDIKPQSSWETESQSISGPAPKNTPGTWVIHYPGSASLYEPMTNDEMIRSLQRSQGQYLSSRGYSYGYSVVASQSGSLWAVRGMEGYPGVRVYNPASNPGKKLSAGNFNDISRSIQIAVGGQNEATPEAVASVNALIATRPTWDVRVHSDVDYTQCAGIGVTHQVRTGVIGHQSTPPKEEELMNPITPVRISDTRAYGVKLAPGTHVFDLNPSVIPSQAKAVALNLTVLNSDGPGFLTVWPNGQRPETACVNFGAAEVANGAIVVGCEGRKVSVYSNTPIDLIVDATAYWG